jgi:hypothetical protein
VVCSVHGLGHVTVTCFRLVSVTTVWAEWKQEAGEEAMMVAWSCQDGGGGAGRKEKDSDTF